MREFIDIIVEAGLTARPVTATAYEKYLQQLSNGIFGKYDFVVFTETNDALGDWSNGGKSSWEVVIFNPVLQRTTAQ